MFKRLFWFSAGAAAGSYATLRVKRRLDRYRPEYMIDRLTTTARRFGRELGAAVAEGKRVVAQREVDLRDSAPRAAEDRPFRVVEVSNN